MEKSFFPEIICSRGFIKQVGPARRDPEGWGEGERGWLAVVGNLSNDDGDGNENGKSNRLRLASINKTVHVRHAFRKTS